MSQLSRGEAGPTADWPDLVDELDRWGDAGRIAELWWRDDDAVATTPDLTRLLRLARGVPVSLAVIPAFVQPELADALRPTPQVTVLQHGWRHLNHAERGKKSEFPAGRLASFVAADIAAGQVRLQAVFGPRALPIFVPPWNRFAPDLLPLLAGRGIVALSAMSSRAGVVSRRGLRALDAHIDLVAWKQGRRFVGEAAALAGLVDRLRAIRQGDGNDPRLPIGILTHHLVMDEATAVFLDRLVPAIEAHPAARWAAAGELLQ